MAKQDSRRVEYLRREYNYNNVFDVVLAAPFEPEVENGCESKFSFYDEIGDAVRKLGKRIFMPHRELLLSWSVYKIYNVANEIVIPSSDIMLCYMGIESTAAEMMVAKAQLTGIPVVYFFEKYLNRKVPVLANGDEPLGKVSIIKFDSDKDGIDKLVENLNRFYEIR